MKKFDIYKTIQLVIFIALTGAALYIIRTDKELYQLIAVNPHIRMLCILLWVVCGISFFFTFLDFTFFSSYKKEYRELNSAVSSDPVSGIANRYGCDTAIEKYLNKPLAKDIGSVMFELTNLQEINQEYGYGAGNEIIRDFSTIIQSAAMSKTFVGRNGGNKFLAIKEDCDKEKMDLFLERVRERTMQHNENELQFPICYKCGAALNESSDIKTIIQLVALSNSRIPDEKFD